MNNSEPIFLDYCSTTPTDPRVISAMVDVMESKFGNPSSRHSAGYRANQVIKTAREQLAGLVGRKSRDIIFTSGATEATNLVLMGLFDKLKRAHVVASSGEHKAMIESLNHLEEKGFAEVTWVGLEADGRTSVEKIQAALRPDTAAVLLMWANNETGVLNPIREVSELCRHHGAMLISDATQVVGKLPIAKVTPEVDALILSSHKFYGPMGVGALITRRDIQSIIQPLIHGGGQERGLRSGTQNVPGIAGLGRAAEIALEEMKNDARKTAALRDEFEQLVLARIDGVSRNGHPEYRLPHVSSISIRGVDGEALIANLRDVCISAGSACNSSRPEPSHVLTSMGLDEATALASIRVSFGRFSNQEDSHIAVQAIDFVVKRLRGLTGEVF